MVASPTGNGLRPQTRRLSPGNLRTQALPTTKHLFSADVSDGFVVFRVCAGEVMGLPHRTNVAGQVEKCPQVVYDILLACWGLSPESRPTFEALGAMLANPALFE